MISNLVYFMKDTIVKFAVECSHTSHTRPHHPTPTPIPTTPPPNILKTLQTSKQAKTLELACLELYLPLLLNPHVSMIFFPRDHNRRPQGKVGFFLNISIIMVIIEVTIVNGHSHIKLSQLSLTYVRTQHLHYIHNIHKTSTKYSHNIYTKITFHSHNFHKHRIHIVFIQHSHFLHTTFT